MAGPDRSKPSASIPISGHSSLKPLSLVNVQVSLITVQTLSTFTLANFVGDNTYDSRQSLLIVVTVD